MIKIIFRCDGIYSYFFYFIAWILSAEDEIEEAQKQKFSTVWERIVEFFFFTVFWSVEMRMIWLTKSEKDSGFLTVYFVNYLASSESIFEALLQNIQCSWWSWYDGYVNTQSLKFSTVLKHGYWIIFTTIFWVISVYCEAMSCILHKTIMLRIHFTSWTTIVLIIVQIMLQLVQPVLKYTEHISTSKWCSKFIQCCD